MVGRSSPRERRAPSRRPLQPPRTPSAPLLDQIFDSGAEVYSAPLSLPGWQHILAVEYAGGSQYDRLVELARQRPLPDRVACLAGAGSGFHGFRDRPWSASPGNIHLTVHLAPQRPIPRFETVFTALAAVAVADAIDTLPGWPAAHGSSG
jgi:hypothetical protein